jgi:N2-acetyl-L-2,4-diaminobutanoate deacetylase
MNTEPFSKISIDIDIDADGKQHGALIIPWSRDESSWGSIPMPLTVIKNGKGPTVLFTGANHGDEYEGPVALCKLRTSLEAADVQGRVIIVPALNLPAFRAGKRTSPIDGGNMNRAFPGNANGTITEMIADFITTRLIARADIVVDIHAGGRSMNLLPMSIIHDLPDAAQMADTLAALKAFGAPYGMILTELDAVGMIDTVVEDAGKVFVSTELGGGATSTVETIAIAELGIMNILKHAGVVAGAPDIPRPSRLIHTLSGKAFVTAKTEGLFEICRELGETVKTGDVIARVHYLEDPEREPTPLIAACDGQIVCRHVPGLIHRGDCAAVICYPDRCPRCGEKDCRAHHANPAPRLALPQQKNHISGPPQVRNHAGYRRLQAQGSDQRHARSFPGSQKARCADIIQRQSRSRARLCRKKAWRPLRRLYVRTGAGREGPGDP